MFRLRRRGLTRALSAALLLTLVGLSGCTNAGTDRDPVFVDPSTPAPSEPDKAALKVAQQLTVRIEKVTCGAGAGSGSGFLIDPHYVVTAYHVVENAREPLAVRPSFANSGYSTSAGTVVGYDVGTDVALIKLSHPLDRGKNGLTNAETPAVVGQAVHEIGYPNGKKKVSVDGKATRWDTHVPIVDRNTDKVLRYIPKAFTIDAESRPGNSGGPVIDNAGHVLGLLDAGPVTNDHGIVVPASYFDADTIHNWEQFPLALGSCEQDDPITLVSNTSQNPDGAALRVYLYVYLDALNRGAENGDEAAWKRAWKLTRGDLHPDTLDEFSLINYGSTYGDATIHCVDTDSSTTDYVNVTYRRTGNNEAGDFDQYEERVLTADIKDGNWKFSRNKPFEGDDIDTC